MLAVLGLDIQLLADDNGSPGAPLSGPEQLSHGPLQVNDEFWVRVLAWDQRDPSNVSDPNVAGDETPGVISLPLNIAWDPTVLMLTSPLPAATRGGEFGAALAVGGGADRVARLLIGEPASDQACAASVPGCGAGRAVVVELR